MIVVKLMGGLGNQMFQYAAGKALAMRHAVPLCVDTSFLEATANAAYTKRQLELDVFSMSLNIATEQVLSTFKLPDSKLQRLVRRHLPFIHANTYYNERGTGYKAQFSKLPANTYLEGYWQNELYFESIKEQLLLDFTPKAPMSVEVAPFLNEMQKETSISLHVRRGDYLSNPSAAAYHGVLPVDYYTKAIQHFKNKIGDFSLFVFSDDLDWCKSNISTDIKTIFVQHTQHAVWDLHLMRQCNHHIIANSSFSWWAAWLGANKQAQVVMPKQWLSEKTSVELGINAKNWLML